MSRILLVYPPMSAEVPAKSTLLGLGYLASALRDGGHEVKICDLVNKQTLDKAMWQFDVLGVSSMFTEYKKDACNFIAQIKASNPNMHIIVGGAHASTFPQQMLEFADTVVVGEGEEVICNIVENKRRGIIVADRIENLDKLPMPAWDLMADDINEMNILSRHSPFLMRKPLAHMITSRGCPNGCTFCAVKAAWGRRWIPRSAGNVVEEIECLYDLGFREIHFNDDNCSVNKTRMYEICNEILRWGIDVKIACPTGIHIGTLDYDLLKLMKRAGFYRLCFGIETGNQDMQKKIKKNLNLDKAREVIRNANRLGYWTAATFIAGFPDETSAQLNDTFEFAKTSGLDFPIFYNLQIQPGTELWNSTQHTKTL